MVNGQTKKWLYLYVGWDIVAVMNEAGTLQETFTRGVGLVGDIGTLVAVTHHTGANRGTHYTHDNHRGDIVLVRTGTTTTATYGYSAFGSLTTQTGTDLSRFKFSSKERETSCGFSYYGYRFYAPQWQRWMNRDPIGEGGGANIYGFAANQPVGNLDPYGQSILGGITRPVIFLLGALINPLFEHCQTACGAYSCGACCLAAQTAGSALVGAGATVLIGTTGPLGGGITVVGAVVALNFLRERAQDCLTECLSSKPPGF